MIRLSSSIRDIIFTSDTHFGHKSILKYQTNRVFDSIDDMDEYLIDKWNKTVGPNSLVFHTGDVSFHTRHITDNIINRLNGTKILVTGNHDSTKNINLRHFDAVYPYLELKIDEHNLVLFHYPIFEWNKKHYGAWHLHGHSHGRNISNELIRRLDIGIDTKEDLGLYTFNEIKGIMLDIPYSINREGSK